MVKAGGRKLKGKRRQATRFQTVSAGEGLRVTWHDPCMTMHHGTSCRRSLLKTLMAAVMLFDGWTSSLKEPRITRNVLNLGGGGMQLLDPILALKRCPLAVVFALLSS